MAVPGPPTIRLRAPPAPTMAGATRDGGALCQTCVDLAAASPDFCPRNNVRHAMPCLSRGSAMTDEYRAKAEYCRQMADQVLSPLDKETWLHLAWDWSTLASVRERYGTHQERARLPHSGAAGWCRCSAHNAPWQRFRGALSARCLRCRGSAST